MNQVILLAIAVAMGIAPAPASAAEADDVAALTQLETVWNQAHMHGDADALDRLWADDLEIAVPKMPVMTRAKALAFARSGRMAFQRYETSDLHVRAFGDAAVVTGRLQRTRTLNGQVAEDDWRFTKVYFKRDGRWQVVAFHASEAARP